MVTVTLGTKKKKFPSIKAASEALDIPYITLYQRYRAGNSLTKKVRPYKKRKVN